MAIGTPTERYAQSLSAQGASSAIHPATTIAAGTLAVMCVTTSTNGKVVSSVTDSVGGNTWVVDKTYTGPLSLLNVSFISCQIVNALTSAATITINYAVTTNNQAHIWIEEVTGMASSSAFDKTNTGDTASAKTLTTGSSGTLSQADEIVFVGTRTSDLTGWAHGTGYSDPTTITLGAPLSSLEYKIVAVTTAVTGSGTWTNNAAAAMVMVTYKGGATAATIPMGTSAAVAATTLAASATTQVPLASAAATAAATLSASAQTQVPLATSAAQSSATLGLSAPTTIPLAASAAAATPTASVSAQTQIPLGASAATATTSLAAKAQTQIPLAASAAVSAATLSLSDETIIPLGTSAAQSSATLTLTTPAVTPPPTPTRDVVSGWKPWLRKPEGAPFHAEVQPALVYARAFPARFTITYRASVATAGMIIRAGVPTLAYDLTAELSRHQLRPVLARDTTDAQPDLLPLWLEEQKIAATREALLRTSLADATARSADLERQLSAVEAARDWNIVRADERAEIVDALMSHTQTKRAPAELPPDDIDREFARLLEDVLIACES